MILRTFKDKLVDFFDMTNYLDDEANAVADIKEGVSFRGPHIIILIIAIFIASLGLNVNSAAVIIGAMLISPLMGPIMGIGLGVGIYDFELFKRSLRNILVASVFSVLASTLYFLVSPVSEGSSELLARTSPTIYDVFIAFFGGGAGIVSAACKKKGNAIPGVAIATALMPPLCTAGYGLGTWQLQYFFGAFYLFLINCIFIALATTLGVKFLKFKPKTFVDDSRRTTVKRITTTIVLITMLPSIWLTFLMLQESAFVHQATRFVNESFVFPNTQVLSKNVGIVDGKRSISVTLIGEKLNTDSLTLAMRARLDSVGLNNVHLAINQGYAAKDATVNINAKEISTEMFGHFYENSQKVIDRQAETMDSLRGIIQNENRLANLSKEIAPEVKVLFPTIKTISLSRNVVCDVSDQKTDTVNYVFVRYGRGVRPQRTKLVEYLEARAKVKNIQLIEQ